MLSSTVGLFKALTGREPGNSDTLPAVNASTGQQVTFLYRKDLSGGGSNIMVRATACVKPLRGSLSHCLL